MTPRGFLQRHGIKRSAIRRDLLCFALPGITILFLGLVVSAADGYDGLTETLWGLITHPARFHQLPAAKLVGLTLFIAGLTLALTGVFTLKRFYLSTLVIREDHRLITHGVYRYTRHPIYLGVLVILVVAVPVYSSSLPGLLVMSALIPIFLVRIKIEERLLTEEFKDAYRTYQRTTRKLIPFIY